MTKLFLELQSSQPFLKKKTFTKLDLHNLILSHSFISPPWTHVEHKHDSFRMKSNSESKWSNDEMECTVTQPYGWFLSTSMVFISQKTHMTLTHELVGRNVDYDNFRQVNHFFIVSMNFFNKHFLVSKKYRKKYHFDIHIRSP
jgi:hypothetical protein